MTISYRQQDTVSKHKHTRVTEVMEHTLHNGTIVRTESRRQRANWLTS